MISDHPGTPCKQCGYPASRINGRTLRESLAHRDLLRRADDRHWIQICPRCDRQDLFDAHQNVLPFLSHDGVMRTARHGTTEAEEVLSLAGFSFTRNALESGIALANREDGDPTSDWSTARVEVQARKYRQAPSPQSALELTDAICKWGRGHRVYGNLEKRHCHTLGQKMDRWMRAALATDTDEAAIASVSPSREDGLPEGLGVSFGSKHLRMLDPDRFAVLDSVLSQGLGYALNPKGYALFMHHLRNLHRRLSDSGWQHTLGRMESGLFILVGQAVRSESELSAYTSDA